MYCFLFQIFRAIANNVEALNFCLDFVYAIVFVRQIRALFVSRFHQVVSVLRRALLAPLSKVGCAQSQE